MTPEALSTFLKKLVDHDLKLSTMIWGPPGIGKSSIVAQTAQAHDMEMIDLRLSQLAPTDLRGLPVADHEHSVSRWYPPEFLPRAGRGVLFLDEVNLAPPAIQGIAQQLILDRKVGSYCYDDQTRVMTRRGLQFFRDLADDDELMTLNPDTGKVEFHVPSRRIELMYKGELLHFQGKCLSICVSPDHNLLVRADWEENYRFRKASDLVGHGSLAHYRVKRTGDWTDNGPTTFTLPASGREMKRAAVYEQIATLRERKVPVASIALALGMTKPAVESRLYYGKNPLRSYNQNRTFDVGDWAEFIGWYVTEGSTAKHHNYRVMISQSRASNPAHYGRIQNLLKRMGFRFQAEADGFTIYSAALYDYLAPLGHSIKRYVPALVKQLPKPALARFFEAALMGDGDGERKIYTASHRLRDDYCEVAIKLGYGATFSWRVGSGFANPENGSWVIGISKIQNLDAGIRTIEHIPYDGKIYCVTVQNHIILVERDGKLAWCGNCVPDGWFIWAAGNRKEDRAAVFDMPAPLANRFIHLVVESDFESFKAYAVSHNIHEHLLAFLSFRPALLHKLDPQQPAWPSPRSWMMANALYQARLDMAPVVGVGAAAEFSSFVSMYRRLPDIAEILRGKGGEIPFPKEPSLCYAVTAALTLRATSLNESYQAFQWIAAKATTEWVQLYATDLFRLTDSRGEIGKLAMLIQRDKRLLQMYTEYMAMIG